MDNSVETVYLSDFPERADEGAFTPVLRGSSFFKEACAGKPVRYEDLCEEIM